VRRLNCVGINGSNPLGFLAAIGLFRHLASELDPAVRMKWEVAGGNWSPTFIAPHETLENEAALLDWLYETLRAKPEKHWLQRLNEFPDECLGLARPSEYSAAMELASWDNRDAADWLGCNGSDLCEAASNSQLQTARRDYFPESAAAIVGVLTRSHLERALFRRWDYGDPIQKFSLHLEPREDRRHAYQWHKPVGDPTRSLRGGMIGANRLAMEAWPLFQSVAVHGELQTVGFRGTRPLKGIRWTWPLWDVPIALCDVSAVLNLCELQQDAEAGAATPPQDLVSRGITTAFRVRRILVEKTPNFTSPMALFAGSHTDGTSDARISGRS
jgi:CRISPR-associated endonuclease/helicase Cas3